MTYPEVLLFINGVWSSGTSGNELPVLNPATGDAIGTVAIAETSDLDQALAAAQEGFGIWRSVTPYNRYRIMRRAAELLRSRADAISQIMTLEQGKPLAESKGEILNSSEIIDWFAEEGRRAYGRINPVRLDAVNEIVIKEPVGAVAAFSPWNFPINQAVLKISAAIAAGCTVILKGPEETPASCAGLVQAFADAGLPAGVLNLVFGVPSQISEYLIRKPAIRKISFTGSTAVGKHLAMLGGKHMKRITMELGGHAPAIVFEDADLDDAVSILSSTKFHNAGQVCISPTRFLVHEKVYRPFLERFIAAAETVKVGNGFDPTTQMGPLAHAGRVEAMDIFVADAAAKGAKIMTGGKRIGNNGFFFAPTVLTDVPLTARVMNEEPFGPLALVQPFKDFDAAMKEANRLAYGLAAYAYTRSANTATAFSRAIEGGVISINHHGISGMPEMPFGGVKDSGYGSEGGLEGIEPYLVTKFITHKSIA